MARIPESTVCYRIIQNHIDSFIQVRTEEEGPAPEYVLREFDTILRCSIYTHALLDPNE
jgi:phenolic acid decarboxylase